MHQLFEDSYLMEGLSPLRTFITDKTYSGEPMELYDDPTGYYCDLTDMDSKIADDITDMSPSLSGEELSNWKLNEVFHNLVDPTSVEQMMSGPVGAEQLFASDDLLSSTLDLLDRQSSDQFTHLPPTNLVETTEQEPDFVPLPVLDCDDESVASSSTTYSAQTPLKMKNTPSKKSGKSKKHKAKVNRTTSVKPDEVEIKPYETKKEAIRRVKNNLASKDFRSRKKYKLEDLLVKEEQLVEDNRLLRADVEAVNEMVQVLKDGLISNARVARI